MGVGVGDLWGMVVGSDCEVTERRGETVFWGGVVFDGVWEMECFGWGM
jgi:hypothetical protein